MKTKIDLIKAIDVAVKGVKKISYGEKICTIGDFFVPSSSGSGISERGRELTVGDVVTACEFRDSAYKNYHEICKTRGIRPLGALSKHEFDEVIKGQKPNKLTYVPTEVEAWDSDPTIAAQEETKTILFKKIDKDIICNLNVPFPPILPLEVDDSGRSTLSPISSPSSSAQPSTNISSTPHNKPKPSLRTLPSNFSFTVNGEVERIPNTKEIFIPQISSCHMKTAELRQRIEQENNRFSKAPIKKGKGSDMSRQKYSEKESGDGRSRMGQGPLYPVIVIPSQNMAWQNPSVVLSESNVAAFLLKGIIDSSDSEDVEIANKQLKIGEIYGSSFPLITYMGDSYLLCPNPEILRRTDWLHNVCGIILSGTTREQERMKEAGGLDIKSTLKIIPGYYFAPIELNAGLGGGREFDTKVLLSHINTSDKRTNEAFKLCKDIGANIIPVIPKQMRERGMNRINEKASKTFWDTVRECVARKNRFLQ